MKEEKERKILFFDEVEFSKAKIEIKQMQKTCQGLIDMIPKQPLLKKHKVTNRDLHGILDRGTEHLQDLLMQAVKGAYEKQAAGLSEQLGTDLPIPKITGEDPERINRVIESLNSKLHKTGRVSPKMLEVDAKGNVVITEDRLAKLKETFTVYDVDPELKEVHELGTFAEAALNRLQDYIDTQHQTREAAIGHKIPYKIDLFSKRREGLAVSPGEANRSGVFYQDGNKWFFNIQKFIG